MQALKNDEYLIKEFRINPNAVILYIKNIFNRIFGIAYFNFGCFIAMVLKRIGYKVYKQLADEVLLAVITGKNLKVIKAVFFLIFSSKTLVTYCNTSLRSTGAKSSLFAPTLEYSRRASISFFIRIAPSTAKWMYCLLVSSSCPSILFSKRFKKLLTIRRGSCKS